MPTSSFKIKINKSDIEDTIRKSILQLVCDLQISMASEVSLLIHDPNYKITDSDVFKVGAELDIEIGFESNFQRLILGDIVSLEPAITNELGAILVVRAYDKSYRLRRNKPVRAPFLKMKDSDIVSQIANETNLTAKVEPTTITHEILQQTGSDWRFLKNRATANGYELFIEFDKLYFQKPPTTGSKTHTLKRNTDIIDLNLRLSAVDQPNLHVVRGWDAKQKQPLIAKSSATSAGVEAVGDTLGAQITSDAFGESRTITFDIPILSQDEAENYAKAEFQNQTRKFILGDGTCLGKPEMKVGEMVELQNIGEKFSGNYYLTQVTHTINSNGYRTKFTIERNAL
jgi:phage protein D